MCGGGGGCVGGVGGDFCHGVAVLDAIVGGGSRTDKVQVVVGSVGRDVVLGGRRNAGGGERGGGVTERKVIFYSIERFE